MKDEDIPENKARPIHRGKFNLALSSLRKAFPRDAAWKVSGRISGRIKSWQAHSGKALTDALGERISET